MYDQQQQAYERSLESEYFTGARIGTELHEFLSRHADECRAVADLITDDASPVFLVGSGGSFANAEHAKYVWDAITNQRVEALASYELVWRAPRVLGPGAVVVLNSLSGETEDTVTALRAAKAAGARTVALVRRADTTLGREADVTIEYDHYFCYEVPVVAMVLIAAEVAVAAEIGPPATRSMCRWPRSRASQRPPSHASLRSPKPKRGASCRPRTCT